MDSQRQLYKIRTALNKQKSLPDTHHKLTVWCFDTRIVILTTADGSIQKPYVVVQTQLVCNVYIGVLTNVSAQQCEHRLVAYDKPTDVAEKVEDKQI